MKFWTNYWPESRGSTYMRVENFVAGGRAMYYEMPSCCLQ